MNDENSYSTDDEEWRIIEKNEMEATAREDVRKLCNKMLQGKDKNHIANCLGMTALSLRKKIYKGTLRGYELLMLSYLCGYEVTVEDKYQLMMDEILNDRYGGSW